MTGNIETLTNEYTAYLTKHGLPKMSADELLYELIDTGADDGHRAWLSNFVDRWNIAQEFEDNKYTLENTGGGVMCWVKRRGAAYVLVTEENDGFWIGVYSERTGHALADMLYENCGRTKSMNQYFALASAESLLEKFA